MNPNHSEGSFLFTDSLLIKKLIRNCYTSSLINYIYLIIRLLIINNCVRKTVVLNTINLWLSKPKQTSVYATYVRNLYNSKTGHLITRKR